MSVLRALCEHEAAHAVTARALGFQVVRVGLDARGGYTEWDSHQATPMQHAAITAAGDLFGRTFGTVAYRDLGCDDLRAFERQHGLDLLWPAERTARDVLMRHRAAVLTLADRLQRERLITFG